MTPPTHPPLGGGVSTAHKSSNRIKLSRLVKHLDLDYRIFSDQISLYFHGLFQKFKHIHIYTRS